MAKTVRYRVVKPVFVNGSLIDPRGKTDVYVMAAEGLEGSALKLAPERGSRSGGAKGSDPLETPTPDK